MSEEDQNHRRSSRRRPPAATPSGREEQMIALAVDLAEKKLMDGTAPNQIIVHYLKLGSTREQLEKTKLVAENEFLRAKVDSLKSEGRVEELYANALDAMRSYSGSIRRPDDDDPDL